MRIPIPMLPPSLLRIALAVVILAGAGSAAAQALNPSGERLVREGGGHPVAPGVYRMQATHSGLCIGVAGVSLPLTRTRVPYLAQIPCPAPEAPATPRVFITGEVELVANGRGDYLLQPSSTAGCVTVARNVILGAPSMDIWPCGDNTSPDQQFHVRLIQGGPTPIVEFLANNGDCIDVRDRGTQVGAELIRFGCSGNGNQRFRLLFVGGPTRTATQRTAENADWYAGRDPTTMISVVQTEGVNFYGGDYGSVAGLSITQCKARCAAEGRCRAVSLVREGVQGPQTMCWLKSSIPAPNADANVSSAIVRP